MRRRALALLTVGLATVVLLGVAPAEATTVAFDEIGPATPGTTVTAGDRNEAGQVTGSTVFAVGRHAYRRSAGGTLTDLGVLGTGTSSSGAALNGSGAVVGTTATTPGGDFRAFLWTESAGMVDLGVLGGDTESSGIDINGSGWIVGRSDGRGWVRDPADGVLVDVGTLPGATTIQMVAINDAGVALGAAFVPGGIIGFTWTEADGIRALPLPDGVASFRPSAITDAGQVLGTDFDLADGYRTWLWDPLIGFTELAGPAGFASVFGADVNERGVVVGFAEDAADDRSLAVWDTVRSPTATVLPSPTAGSIDASIDVVTDTGGLLASTNEIVDEDDVERGVRRAAGAGPRPGDDAVPERLLGAGGARVVGSGVRRLRAGVLRRAARRHHHRHGHRHLLRGHPAPGDGDLRRRGVHRRRARRGPTGERWLLLPPAEHDHDDEPTLGTTSEPGGRRSPLRRLRGSPARAGDHASVRSG